MTPGNCWAFAGDRGQVTIRLAQKVYLSNITLQHIPKTISLSGSLDTAPKDFVIYVSTRWRGSQAGMKGPLPWKVVVQTLGVPIHIAGGMWLS